MQGSSPIEGSEYFDEPTNAVEEARAVIKPPRSPPRPSSRTLTVVSAKERRSANRRQISESEDSDYSPRKDHCRRYRDDTSARCRSRSSGRGTRTSHSRHRGMDDEGKSSADRLCMIVCAARLIFSRSSQHPSSIHTSAITSTFRPIQTIFFRLHASSSRSRGARHYSCNRV